MLIVCSNSTRKFCPGGNSKILIVTEPPKKDILKLAGSEDSVMAIGGGAVIDTAKIISRNPIECYPTTAAGSSDTKHSVYWDGERKMNYTSHIPDKVGIDPEIIKSLPRHVIHQTRYDLISHCIDSLHSIHNTQESEEYSLKALEIISKSDDVVDLVEAGRLGGKAIQITTTNLLHALSYPLTGRYDISHGIALSYLIEKLKPLFDVDLPKLNLSEYMKYTIPTFNTTKIDWDWVIEEAYTYNKIEDFCMPITKEKLGEMLK